MLWSDIPLQLPSGCCFMPVLHCCLGRVAMCYMWEAHGILSRQSCTSLLSSNEPAEWFAVGWMSTPTVKSLQVYAQRVACHQEIRLWRRLWICGEKEEEMKGRGGITRMSRWTLHFSQYLEYASYHLVDVHLSIIIIRTRHYQKNPERNARCAWDRCPAWIGKAGTAFEWMAISNVLVWLRRSLRP